MLLVREPWGSRNTVGRVFWLWGIAGNALYIVFFFVWPFRTIDLIQTQSDSGRWLGACFLVLSAVYMTFSFSAGLITVVIQKPPRPAGILASLSALLLFLAGGILWIC